MLPNKRGRDSKRPAHRDEEWPPLAATRESLRTEMKTEHSQINKLNKFKKKSVLIIKKKKKKKTWQMERERNEVGQRKKATCYGNLK